MRIFYSALLLTGVNLMLRLVGTSFQVYLSGRIGAAGVGLLQLVLSVGSLAMTAGIAGVRTATMYLTAEQVGRKQPGNVRWVLSGCITYSICFSGTVAAALYCFAPAIAQSWIGDPAAAPALRLFAVFLPTSCLCGVMTGYFTAANRIGTLAAVEVAEQLCTIGLTLLFLTLWAGNDPARAAWAVVLGSGTGGCITLCALTALRILERVPPAPRLPVRKALLETALPLAAADNLRSGISTAENLMVPRRLALYPAAGDPLAAFGTVSGMVFPVLMFPAAILYALAELLIPELARCNAAGSSRRIRYLSMRSMRLTLLYGCCFCGLMYLLAEPLCIALYSSPQAGLHLRRFALLIPMLYCDAITDAGIKGMGQQKVSVRYNILTGTMDVAFLFLLLPRFGMDGYFASFLVTHLLNFFLSYRKLSTLVSAPLPGRVWLTVLLSTGAGILLAGFCPPVLGAGVFLLCFFCLITLGGVLSREDSQWLRGLLRQ